MSSSYFHSVNDFVKRVFPTHFRRRFTQELLVHVRGSFASILRCVAERYHHDGCPGPSPTTSGPRGASCDHFIRRCCVQLCFPRTAWHTKGMQCVYLDVCLAQCVALETGMRRDRARLGTRGRQSSGKTPVCTNRDPVWPASDV